MIGYFSYANTELEEGHYLLRVQGELYLAEYLGGHWLPTGVDYDPWQYVTLVPTIEVICKLDLEKIALAAAKESRL